VNFDCVVGAGANSILLLYALLCFAKRVTHIIFKIVFPKKKIVLITLKFITTLPENKTITLLCLKEHNV
jgi:hypothetical protein